MKKHSIVKKHKGFSLIETLVSMVLMGFTVIMIETVIMNSSNGTISLGEANENRVALASQMENNISLAKQYAMYYKSTYGKSNLEISNLGLIKPSGYTTPITVKATGLKIEGKDVKQIDGYIVSSNFDNKPSLGNKNGYIIPSNFINKPVVSNKWNNKVQQDDTLKMFVGITKEAPLIANIEKVYLDNDNRYVFADLNNLLNLKYAYTISSKNKSVLKAVRSRASVSPVDNGNVIYPPYVDESWSKYLPTLSPDTYALLGDTDNEDESKNNKYFDILNISYTSDKKQFLHSIDKSYTAYANTLNETGYAGVSKSSLMNENEVHQQNTVHVIGLPLGKPSAMYDHNFLVSKDINKNNIFYSLFDKHNYSNTQYNYLITEDNDRYNIKWDVDTLKLIGYSSSDTIKMPNGYSNKIIKYSQTIADAQKSYGYTLYYDMNTQDNSINILPNKTYFIKYNINNYTHIKTGNLDNQKAYVLASHNINFETGKRASNSGNGFAIYVDNLGNLKKYTITEVRGNEVYNVESLGYNMNDNNLYTDEKDKYEFSILEYEHKNDKKRDGRQDFNIISLNIKNSTLNISILKRKLGLDKKLETEIKNISTSIDNGYNIYFGTQINTVQTDTDVIKVDNTPTEISDVIVYEGIKNANEIGMTMDYLYRKYLTESERDNFDKFFIRRY